MERRRGVFLALACLVLVGVVALAVGLLHKPAHKAAPPPAAGAMVCI